ncbi:MAG: PAS domain S-box protein [Proteobacteria bacterium]|nr:PAS domain S-box protein [Pseudomonadota bacterium]
MSPPACLHVLLVEDSRDDADLILLELEMHWPDIVFQRVDDEAQMREALAAQPWDVVISDYHLPRFGATAALELLRGLGCDLPLIAVSGFVGEESAAALIKAGASDFVVKDNLPRLQPAIERALREAAIRRDHERAQEALRLSEKRLRAITNAVGEALFTTDARGALLWMNPEAERLLGWSEEELLGKQIHSIIHRPAADAPPSDPACCGSLLALRSGQTQRIEDDIYLHKDGTPVPVSFVATPLIEDGRIVGAVSAAQPIGARKRVQQELLEARRRSQELSAHLQSVREEERTHIARELHDELGQLLTAIKMDAAWLRARLPTDADALHGKLAGMTQLIDSTVDWVRRMSSELRPVMLDDLGLRDAVEWFLEGFGHRHGIDCSFDAAAAEDLQTDKPRATAAFRIIQECLTNIARHAAASRVLVSLERDTDAIEITVSDNGRGFDPATSGTRSSFGLLGIRERAEALGGSCTIRSAPGQGTTISVCIPLGASTPDDEDRPR